MNTGIQALMPVAVSATVYDYVGSSAPGLIKAACKKVLLLFHSLMTDRTCARNSRLTRRKAMRTAIYVANLVIHLPRSGKHLGNNVLAGAQHGSTDGAICKARCHTMSRGLFCPIRALCRKINALKIKQCRNNDYCGKPHQKVVHLALFTFFGRNNQI